LFVNNTTISTIFGSNLRAKILGWFFLHSDERFYVRQLAGLLKEDLANLSRELQRLERLGILYSTKQANQKYYCVNTKNPIHLELKGLIIKTIGLVDVLKEVFNPIKKNIKIAFIYGSFAKDKQALNSDIDLMVIGKISFGEVVRILEKAEKKIGREINPVVMDESEMKERLKKQDHFLTKVFSETKIWLIGNE